MLKLYTRTHLLGRSGSQTAEKTRRKHI